MNGIELARRHYLTEVAPVLAGVPHAAALLGSGSEVLGFDDEVSTDHDFGPRVQIFRPDRDTVGRVLRRAARLSTRAPGVGVADWLLTPTQLLASLTGGAVFHDPDGELARRRAALAWYPDDVWRYALAAGWLKVAQEEAFIGRTGSTGDDLGSRILAARLARELIRLAFLVERRWAPYGKWLGRAFAELDARRPARCRCWPAPADWREREPAMVTAAGRGRGRDQRPRPGPPVDPGAAAVPRPRHPGAGRGAVHRGAVRADHRPAAAGAAGSTGRRRDEPVGRLPGTIDQAVDSTDVLTDPDRFRAAAAPMLGLR